MRLRPAPAEHAPVDTINEWCGEADQHLAKLGVGFAPDVATQLLVRALAAAMGVPADEFEAHFAIARLRFLTGVMEQAEAAANRAKLLGGIHLPGQNGHPK